MEDGTIGADMEPRVQVFMPTKEGISECRKTMEAILERSEPIALDAEGVKLSKHGRLTLLQFCTRDKFVYIADFVHPKEQHNRIHAMYMMKEGKIRDVLQSEHILKITHGCANDQAALFCQFDVLLKNVFDTQCAHLAIQYFAGRYFPRMLRLDKLCEMYNTTTHTSKDFAVEFRENPKLWEQRPLSSAAVQYAVNDVSILHELYSKLHKKMETMDSPESKKLFAEITDEELLSKVDEDRIVKAKRARRRQNMKLALKDPEFLKILEQTPDVKLHDLPEDFESAVSTLCQYGGQFERQEYQEAVWLLAEESAKELLEFFNQLVDRGELSTKGMSHQYRIQRIRLQELADSGIPGHIQNQAKKFQLMIENNLLQIRSNANRAKDFKWRNKHSKGF